MNRSGLSECVLRFTQRLQKEDVNMHGFLLSVRGKKIAEAYYAPFREGQPHRLYSVSKTFTGIAVGMFPVFTSSDNQRYAPHVYLLSTDSLS